MREQLGKPLRYFSVAVLGGAALYAIRAENTSNATEVQPNTTVKSTVTYSNPDILAVCRQQDQTIDQTCAARHAQGALEEKDDVMAGIWTRHVSDPTLAYQIDQGEFNLAQQADLAEKAGDCAMWSIRVEASDLLALLPECG